jgi:hypothetical protein
MEAELHIARYLVRSFLPRNVRCRVTAGFSSEYRSRCKLSRRMKHRMPEPLYMDRYRWNWNGTCTLPAARFMGNELIMICAIALSAVWEKGETLRSSGGKIYSSAAAVNLSSEEYTMDVLGDELSSSSRWIAGNNLVFVSLNRLLLEAVSSLFRGSLLRFGSRRIIH